jgi:hypothetical protein
MAHPRRQNFYSEYGTLIHLLIEKFFKGELEPSQLSDYYLKNYNRLIVTPPPPYPAGMRKTYGYQGLAFFNSFSFEKDLYDLVGIEDSLNFSIGDLNFVARPDLVLRNKETGHLSLWDYKTALPFKIDKKTGKETIDKHKIAGYHRQMYIYTHALRVVKELQIAEINLWFPRNNRILSIPCVQEDEDAAIKWMTDTISLIKEAEEFPPIVSPYFCQNICSVRDHCIYKP